MKASFELMALPPVTVCVPLCGGLALFHWQVFLNSFRINTCNVSQTHLHNLYCYLILVRMSVLIFQGLLVSDHFRLEPEIVILYQDPFTHIHTLLPCSAEINIKGAENNTHPQSLKISTKISPPRFWFLFPLRWWHRAPFWLSWNTSCALGHRLLWETLFMQSYCLGMYCEIHIKGLYI